MDKQFTFELSEAEVNTILGALSELPFKVSQSIIAKLVNTFNVQNRKSEVIKDVVVK